MAFFNDGNCKGVVYYPNVCFKWPGNYSGIPSEYTKGLGNAKRPWIVRSKNTEGPPAFKEFSPWNGVWPASGGTDMWNGIAGIDAEGYVVGTAPVIELA